MNIRKGDKGEKVKALQHALNESGFKLEEDGIFAANTEAAVRSFQKKNNLGSDGVAGEKTLAALGLDPETAAPVSGGVSVITFTEDEVNVPEVVQKRIREFADKTIDNRNKILTSTLNALANFETTMVFASTSEANPDVLGALVSTAINKAVDAIIDEVPVLSKLKPFYDAVTEELERAAKAKESHEIGDWIKDQRAVIDRNLQVANASDAAFELEESYLDLDPDGRENFFQELFEASNRIDTVRMPNIDELECEFYEQWINAHFKNISDEADGCIEFRNEFEDDAFEFESCTVQAPSGDKIESALNRLFDRGHVPDVRKPIDLRVRKRATFRVENFVGGKSWSAGWLDANNEVIHTPVHPPAVKALNLPDWRQTQRFQRD